MECHFPAVGLLPCTGGELTTHAHHVAVIGINPPEEVTSLDSLIRGEELRGIGLWRKDLYGVSEDLARKRRKRGWECGMEKAVFSNQGLEDAVEHLICWGGGAGNEWFPGISELPWCYKNTRAMPS